MYDWFMKLYKNQNFVVDWLLISMVEMVENVYNKKNRLIQLKKVNVLYCFNFKVQ